MAVKSPQSIIVSKTFHTLFYTPILANSKILEGYNLCFVVKKDISFVLLFSVYDSCISWSLMLWEEIPGFMVMEMDSSHYCL